MRTVVELTSHCNVLVDNWKQHQFFSHFLLQLPTFFLCGETTSSLVHYCLLKVIAAYVVINHCGTGFYTNVCALKVSYGLALVISVQCIIACHSCCKQKNYVVYLLQKYQTWMIFQFILAALADQIKHKACCQSRLPPLQYSCGVMF